MHIFKHVLILLKRYEFTNLGMPAGSKDELKRFIPQKNTMKYSGIPIFRTSWLGKRKLVRKIARARGREIGRKITVFDRGEGTNFGSSYREVRKNEGSRNWDSTVL